MNVQKGMSKETTTQINYDNDKLIEVSLDFDSDSLFSLTVDDFNKLLQGILSKKILSKKIWKLSKKYDDDEQSIFFSPVNGFHCRSTEFFGFGIHTYFNFKDGIAFGSIVNEEQILEHAPNGLNYFRKESRDIVTSLFTYPKNTKMKKINKNNYWDALQLEVEAEQRQNVLDAKSSVAMSLVHKEKIGFVQMEGTTAVGLLVLNVDHKKKEYSIDIIIIDKKFQGRGYGKLMVKWAVDYLKDKGANRLTIGVKRTNVGAKKIYLNAGFKPSSVYSGGMELSIKL
jgi:diamine N-acetyltransferase